MLEAYSQEALDELLAQVPRRRGWDFSRMNVLRQPVPWNYHDLVVRYLRLNDSVLDIGTGGGETFSQLATSFGQGLGIDTDAQMIQLAVANSTSGNVRFRVGSARLEAVSETFDVILDRQAPFDLDAIAAHLKPAGYFVTQQVGERNMACVQAALGAGDSAAARPAAGVHGQPAAAAGASGVRRRIPEPSATSNLCSSGSVAWTASMRTWTAPAPGRRPAQPGPGRERG